MTVQNSFDHSSRLPHSDAPRAIVDLTPFLTDSTRHASIKISSIGNYLVTQGQTDRPPQTELLSSGFYKGLSGEKLAHYLNRTITAMDITPEQAQTVLTNLNNQAQKNVHPFARNRLP